MSQYFGRRTIELFVEKGLINEEFAQNLLSWKHSGISIDHTVRILDKLTQESLAEYIARRMALPPALSKEDPL